MEVSFKNQYATSNQTKFRYFKLSFIKTNENRNYVQASEFNFFDNDMNKFPWGREIKVIQSEGVWSPTESFDYLIDDNVRTKFCGFTPDADQDYIWWAIFDLGEHNMIDVIAYHKFGWYNANDTANNKNRRVFKLKIELSNDLKSWLTGADVENLNTTAENYALAYVGDFQH